MANVVELLPKEYGYVVIILVLYCFLNLYMAVQVGKARKKGHQNSLELMPFFFLLMTLGGLKHPYICSALRVVYIISQYFYFAGYSTGEPQNRLKIGMYSMVAFYPLFICAISFGFSLLLQPASP